MKKAISAGGVVVNINGEILIVNQKGYSWSLPKGHVHGEEDLLETAKREIHEESGINELVLHTYLGSFSRLAPDPDDDTQKEFKTLHFFLFTTDQLTLSPLDTDNPEARWIRRDEVDSYLRHPEDKEFFNDTVAPQLLSLAK